MGSDIRDSSAMLAYFWEGDTWLVYPTVEEIGRVVPLRTVLRVQDGELDEGAPDSSEGEH